MIVYRDVAREVETAAEIERLRRVARSGDALDLLVSMGELEQALVDARRPTMDGHGRIEAVLRRASLLAGRAFVEGGRALVRDTGRRILSEIDKIPPDALPPCIVVKPPEGYVHYALDPAGYVRAARLHRQAVGDLRAARSVVIGVRSIGTSLSAVVAAALGSERTFTVRPRGASGDRRILADAGLSRRLAEWIREPVDVAIVDEGPGATGETLEAVAAWVSGLGANDEHIILFPSRSWGMSLAPSARRSWFEAARKRPPPPNDPRAASLAARLGLDDLEDLSAGRWRTRIPGAGAVPACADHERLKFRGRRADGSRCLIRYAGLGRWGEETLARAECLAEAGIGPEVLGLESGLLVLRWIVGRPATPREMRRPEFIDALGAYLAARAPCFEQVHRVDREPMLHVLRTNALEALGSAAQGLGAALERLERLPDRVTVVPDGRLQRWEWVRTWMGFAKVDSIDHGDGLRYPGPTDRAWDLAGAAIEFSLDDHALAGLVRRCAAASGDSATELAEAVAAYRPAYAALQLGASTLSAYEAALETDRNRWKTEAARYRRALAAELAVAGRTGRSRVA